MGTLKWKSFHLLSQICSYGVLIKQRCYIDKIKWVVFNDSKTWVFELGLLMKKFDDILINENNQKSLPWRNYLKID